MVGSELAQKYIGEGRMVRELFSLAKEKAPSVIFLDEIGPVGPSVWTVQPVETEKFSGP